MHSKTVAILVVVALAAACGGSDPAGEPSTSTSGVAATSDGAVTTTPPTEPLLCAEPIVVGVVTDLSGGGELFGSQLARGVSIGMAFVGDSDPQEGMVQSYRVDDCEFRVVFGDDQSNPEVAAIVAGKLVEEDGASILIGSVGQDTTAAVAEVADAAGVVLVATTDTADGLTAAEFRTASFLIAPSLDQEAMALCSLVVGDGGATRLAQIAPDYGFGQRTAAARRESCETLGAEFVAEDALVSAGTGTFDTVLEPIVTADPDTVLIAWTGGRLKALLSAAADGGLDVGTVFGSHRLVPVLFAAAIGTSSPVAYHHEAVTNAANDYLIDEVGSATGFLPDIHDARGMAAAMLVVAGARAGGDAGSPEALEGISVAGPGGSITMRASDHTTIQDIPLVKLTSATGPDFFEFLATVRPEPPCRLTGEHAARCP